MLCNYYNVINFDDKRNDFLLKKKIQYFYVQKKFNAKYDKFFCFCFSERNNEHFLVIFCF